MKLSNTTVSDNEAGGPIASDAKAGGIAARQLPGSCKPLGAQSRA
jgi:hypothetical protein